jgi:hypothetical protein
MALEMQDLMALKNLGSKEGMTPYEQVKLDYMSAKKPSGVAIAGLTVASVAAAAGITAWIFGPLYGNAKAGQAKEAAIAAKELAIAKNDGLRDLVQTLASTVAAERSERIEGDKTLSISINDTVSGQQQGQLSASQIATNEATAQILAGVMTGQYQQSPQRVSLWQEGPCNCPASGCGCNG